ncbi:hypothetical protein HN803_00395 [candidate division WWE3 bacterium]|nr:hypothetical protein [candidate division WWE3 bacterium]MBT7349244.1 hypothetical protein [candidate division WWE3 bacterium]
MSDEKATKWVGGFAIFVMLFLGVQVCRGSGSPQTPGLATIVVIGLIVISAIVYFATRRKN